MGKDKIDSLGIAEIAESVALLVDSEDINDLSFDAEPVGDRVIVTVRSRTMLLGRGRRFALDVRELHD